MRRRCELVVRTHTLDLERAGLLRHEIEEVRRFERALADSGEEIEEELAREAAELLRMDMEDYDRERMAGLAPVWRGY